MMKTIPDFLEGAVDLHVHSAPDIDPRRYDDIELAGEAVRAGMAALVLKSHQTSTVERAHLVSKVVPGIRVFGGLVLNDPVGGLNPAAVKVALKLGAKQIWMPTRSARNHRAYCGEPGGISVRDSEGGIVAPLREILELIAGADCILGTGHLSPLEGGLLVEHARRCGVKKILITHPEWQGTCYPVDLQRRLAVGGDVMFERCFVCTTHRAGRVPVRFIAETITEVGVETTILSTDLGQPDTLPPADGLRRYAEQLLAFGFSRDDLRRMMETNPRRLLSLNCGA